MSYVFNIYGCCVSRDIFSINSEHIVDKYVAFINPVSASQAPPLKRLTVGYLEQMYEKKYSLGDNNFRKRCFYLDYNKEIFDYLSQDRFDYLVLDLAELRFNLYELEDGTIISRSLFTDSHEFQSDMPIRKQKIGMDIPWEGGIKQCLDVYCEKVKEIVDPSRVIINEVMPVKFYVDSNGFLRKFDPKWTVWNIDKVCEILEMSYKYIEDKLEGCHIIKMPENMLGNELHRWGKNPLHFTDIYYEYGAKAIEIITSNNANMMFLLENLKASYELMGKIAIVEAENKKEYSYLKNQNNEFKKMISSFLVENSEISLVEHMLKMETDAFNYLYLLSKFKKFFWIFLSVRDTAGDQLTIEMLDLLQRGLGFKKITKDFRVMYLGVELNGNVMIDYVSEKPEDTICIEKNIIDLNIKLKSSSFKKENVSSNMLNGIEYSTNVRGINITVYNPVEMRVVDSIGFDYFYGPHEIVRLDN